VVICLERCVDLNMAQLMPLLLTASCSNKIQIGFTFLVLAHLGSPRQRAIKRVCVCVCVRACVRACVHACVRVYSLMVCHVVVGLLLMPVITQNHQIVRCQVTARFRVHICM